MKIYWPFQLKGLKITHEKQTLFFWNWHMKLDTETGRNWKDEYDTTLDFDLTMSYYREQRTNFKRGLMHLLNLSIKTSKISSTKYQKEREEIFQTWSNYETENNNRLQEIKNQYNEKSKQRLSWTHLDLNLQKNLDKVYLL